jgi:transglutaminase-like putative cysteine protease
MLAVCRSAGVPARYVSGYLYTEKPPAGDGAMHAWVEAYLPGGGWIGLDPTHGLLVDHQYVKVAVGRAYVDVPPTRGMFRGPQEHTIAVQVRVTTDEAYSGVQAFRSSGAPRIPLNTRTPEYLNT